MGCTSSFPDPNDMYGSEHKNIAPYSSTRPQNGTSNNNNNDASEKNIKNKRNNTLKGDISQYSDAKLKREKKLRDALLNREILAKEMSDNVMEEKERLSLTSSRSRATSPRSARHCNGLAVKSPNLSVHSRVTTRSIGDIGIASPTSSMVFHEHSTTNGNQSNTVKTSEKDTESQSNGVKWKDQNGVVSGNGILPEETNNIHSNHMPRAVSRISEKSELPDESKSSKI